MKTELFSCFGTRDGVGNPALVIEGAERDAEARLRHAKQVGMTCVFIDTTGEANTPFELDFYYPHARSPLCLHATLAAAAVIACDAAVRARTAMRGQVLELSRRGDAYYVALDAQPAGGKIPGIDELRALLARPGLELAGEPAIASVGSPKLLVQLKDVGTLQSLEPDLEAITRWGRTQQVNGIYAWCSREDGDLEGRNFNHLDPRMEDSATGVAAGALTVLLGRALRVHQGSKVGRPCLIHTAIEGNQVLVGGAVARVSGAASR